MATFNTSTHAAGVLNSSITAAPLHLDAFVPSAVPTHFISSTPTAGPTHGNPHHHHHQQQQQQQTNTTSSYTFVQIKREPCQVSEVTTSNNCNQSATTTTTHHHQQHHGIMSASNSISASKTMSSSSTLTTLVKIEASSPKMHEMDKTPTLTAVSSVPNTNNSVPIGIAVARKRPQESSVPLSSSIPMQQNLNKDMTCFGIRMGSVGGSCSNIYFTGNGDLMTGATTAATAEELALSAAGVQSVNRAPSTFWQYPSNALPIESVISMSPATVGLQYSREASRGQVVLLPATTALDPFQQAAAAFVWPATAYIPQASGAAPAAATALQPPPNFIFPSMSPHSTLQPQSYATSLQLFGSNYLSAAAAAAAAAASNTLCQHNQQTASQTSSSINLSLAGTGGSTTSSSCSTSSRFLSMAAAELQKQSKHQLPNAALPISHTPSAASVPPLLMPPAALKIEDWNAAEYITAAAKTATTSLSQQNQLAPPLITSAPPLNFEARDKTTTTTTTTMTTNLLELQGSTAQALNLMRLPTPPTSATMASAQHLLFQTTSSPSPALLNLSATALPRTSVVSSASACVPISTTAANSSFLNGTSVAHFSTTNIGAAGGPLTPLGDDATAVNYKIASPTGSHSQIVVPVPRTVTVTNYQSQSVAAAPPQMQDVNIQTDTPVCSEDENSSCPLAIQQHLSTTLSASAELTNAPTHGNIELYAAHDNDAQQPLELTRANAGKSVFSAGEAELVAETNVECHNNAQRDDVEQRFADSPELRLSSSGQVTNPSVSASPAAVHETVPPVNNHTPEQVAPEDLTGLELLSNISTSTLAKSVSMRVKQEPLEQMDAARSAEELLPQVATEPCDTHAGSEMGIDGCCSTNRVHPFLVPPVAAVEPLGGLSLLCALAEQRIQEEVQSSGGSLFTAVPPAAANNENVPSVTPTPTPTSTSLSAVASTPFHFQRQSPFGVEAAFPSMEGIELPSTSCMANGVTGEAVKRKKHKHSKSSKSSSSSTSASGKKAQRCNKKNKKNKYSKEMRKKHKLLAQVEPDWEDEQVQEVLNSAFGCVDATNYTPFGKWHNPQEIFSMMETNMRMRLADISRQYRRKKRKLDEISHKNKKKKKCSKLAAVSGQQLVLGGSSALSLGGVPSCSTPTATLGEYKFSNFACAKSSSAHGAHMHASSFLRFGEKTQHLAQFPPPDMGTLDGSAEQQQLDARNGSASTSAAAATVYKPVRLEPSALSAADSRGLALRVGHKHASSEQSAQMIVCKERKLMTTPPTSIASNTYKHTSEGRGKCSGGDLPALQNPQSQQPAHRNSNDDGCLMLTDEHLYSKETRVLTDMGGLFYAGVMKPLQPPDVYAITLDGERGNKPHIMSREEILKDTILELAPKSVESVPVGTRLCAYWSQQYRCLYPGRAIESESSDDGSATPDFVSVEFDDGDSGRIRLQNIRLLLSDYPIVEYNDNPLYSIGKHKKSSASACADKSGVDDRYSPVSQQQYSCSLLEEPVNGVVERLSAPSAAGEVHQQTALKLFATRSEKKRIKSLKKKAQATVNGGAGAAGDSTAVGVGEASSNDCSRKHHKHKKRKKHKKHHHRKMALNGNSNSVVATAEGNAFMLSSCSNNSTPVAAATPSSFINKREFEHLSHITLVTEEQQGEYNAHVDDSEAEQQLNDAVIKTEGPSAVSAGDAIKVKTEHLDLEEETTSNLMSEVSDENKGEDEVEHNNSKGSKIAAFLPERQLWGWLGTAYRKAGVKGRARKQFYKTIKRGKETITVGDCAVFLSTGRPDRPYIGRIESMWETTSSNKVVRVRWFYHPEETTGCSNLQFPGALFESPHEDENDVQTISHRCEVLPFARYFSKFGADSKQYQSIYDNNDTYYLAGYYNPRSQVLNIQDDIPTLEEERNISEV